MAETEGVSGQSQDGGESKPVLGTDLVPPSRRTAPTSEGGAPGRQQNEPAAQQSSAQDFDPTKIDWLYARDEDVPEQYRPLAARGREAMSKLNERLSSERSAMAADADRRVAAMRAELDAARAKPATAATTHPQPGVSQQDDLQFKASLVQALGINTQDDFDAANNIMFLAERIAQRHVEQLEARLMEKLGANESTQKVQQLEQTINALRLEIYRGPVETELSAARSGGYSDQDLNGMAEAIIGVRKLTNPATGRRYTVLEAADRITGKQRAVPNNGNSQPTGANPKSLLEHLKRQGAGPATTVAGPASEGTEGGTLTAAQAEAKMDQLLAS